jgi:hypothetical protein
MLASPQSIDPEVHSPFSALTLTTPPGVPMLKMSLFVLFPFFLMSCGEETNCTSIGYLCAEGTVACDPDADGETCVGETFGEEGCEQTLFCMPEALEDGE